MDKTRNFNDITANLCKQNESKLSDSDWKALAVVQFIIDNTPPETRRQILESCCKQMEG